MAVQRRIPRLTYIQCIFKIQFIKFYIFLYILQVVVRKLPERGSVLAQKNKKENGNYLLNFHYERDKVGDIGGLNRDTRQGYRYSCKSRLIPSMQQHKYKKEQFIQSR